MEKIAVVLTSGHKHNVGRSGQQMRSLVAGKSIVFICLGLILLNIAIYGQTRHYGMVYGDEKVAADIFQNGLTLSNLKKVFIGSVHFPYFWQPVAFFVCALDAQFFGKDPGPRHLVNLFLHIASTLLLFVCFAKMTEALWPSALVAGLFAVHPINVEAVAWLAFHDSSLNLFFISISLLAYIQYTRATSIAASRIFYFLFLSAFVCAMLSHPRIMAFPFLLLLIDYWPLGRRKNRTENKHSFRKEAIIREKIPLFAFSLAFSAIMVALKYQHPKNLSVTIHPLDILVSYAAYLAKLFFPEQIISNRCLCPFHPSMGQILASAVLLSVISVVALVMARKGRAYFPVGWLWFLLALSPAVIMNAGKHVIITDRYAYLGAVGIFLIIAFGLADLTATGRVRQTVANLLVITLLTFFTGLSWQYTRHWKNSVTLAEYTIARLPDRFICHDTVGKVFLQNNRIDKALSHLRIALHTNPSSAELHLYLGIALQASGKTNQAIHHFKKALTLDPYSAKAYHNLGNALFDNGDTEAAISCYNKALALDPAAYGTYNSLAVAYAHLGDMRKAKACLQKALQINPAYYSARKNLEILRQLSKE